MKLQWIVLLAASGAILIASLSAKGYDDQQQQQQQTTTTRGEISTRTGFVMPKLFDFATFREKFHKQYANAAEMARRAKVFMARAFAVFISAVKYRYRKASKFLKINPRSDWTPEEREASLNYEGLERPSALNKGSSAEHGAAPLPAANLEDVERKLAEIVARKDEDPDFAAAASAFESIRHRSKRHAEPSSADGPESESESESKSEPRKLTMEQLMGEDDRAGVAEMSPKYAAWTSSNNPQYKQPETFSEAADEPEDVDLMRSLSDEEAERVDIQANLGQYLNDVFNSLRGAAGLLFSPAKVEDVVPVRLLEPDEVYLDYRDTGCFLQPKDQLQCGSCYVFATTALLEYQHCRQRGKLVPFSEQYAIDCGKERQVENMNGCNGGVEKHVGIFYARYGLELSVDYPYRAKEQRCPYDPSTSLVQMGHTRIREPEVAMLSKAANLKPHKIKQLLVSKGPLYMSMFTPDDFTDYGGGVDVLNCDLEKKGGHAMVIIGDGIEDGLEYWLVRNSYGVKFGLHGYYKLAKQVKPGCLFRIGYVVGNFKKNVQHKGKSLFDEMKKKNLLVAFAPNQYLA